MADALLAPWISAASRTYWPGLMVFAAVALVFFVVKRPGWRLRWHTSHLLDLQLLLGRQLLGVLVGSGKAGLAFSVGVFTVGALSHLGQPGLTADVWSPVLYSVVLFVVWDFSRFVTHWLMHRVPALWAFHQVHHSAEVLTPLTFHRVHPVESVVYGLRGGLVTGVVAGFFFWLYGQSLDPLTLLGVPAAGFVLNTAFGNLRHSHVWIRFGPLERWFISPAQHQLHHGLHTRDTNYGTWLAIWDRMWGTLVVADEPPSAYGVEDRNHGNDLLSAWFGPFRNLLPLSLLLLAFPALAQEPAEDEDEEPPPPASPYEGYGSILVTDPDGTPRVAGSAHLVDEEALQTFEYDDISKVVATVPGMTVRGEDGYGLRPNLGIRGANSDRSAKLTLMEDGVLFAPAPYAAPAAYYFPMTTRVTAVEVFKGPAATRFGPQTVGGAVNLRTRAVPTTGPVGAVDLAGGLRQTGKLHAWAGTGNPTAGVLVEGVHLRTDGFKELDGGGPTGFDRTETMLKAYWRPVDAHRLQLKLGWANETSNETYLGLNPTDFADTPYRRYAASGLAQMNWSRTQVQLSHRWSLDHGYLRTVAYHHYLDRRWQKLNAFGAGGVPLHSLLQSAGGGQSDVYLAILRGEEDSVGDAQSLLIGTNHRTFHSYGVQTVLRLNRYGAVDHELELGLRLHQDQVWRVHTEDAYGMKAGELIALGEDTVTTLDSWATAQALAFHVHDDLSIDRLHVLPGVRVETIRTDRVDDTHDSNPLVRTAVLPGVGALVELTPWVHAFAGAHRGFSPVAPGQAEEVKPEISNNYELGLRADQGDRQAEVVGFFNDYKNLTGQCTLSGGCVGDAVDQQFNGGQVFIYGAEATAGWTLYPGPLSVPLRASYAWTEGGFRTGFVSGFPQFGSVEAGDWLPYVPHHQASGNVGLVHDRGSLNAGVTWRSAMLDSAGDFGDETDLPALLLVDAAAAAQVGPRAEVYVTGTNLLNNQAVVSWRPFGARPTAPRQVMVGVRVQ